MHYQWFQTPLCSQPDQTGSTELASVNVDQTPGVAFERVQWGSRRGEKVCWGSREHFSLVSKQPRLFGGKFSTVLCHMPLQWHLPWPLWNASVEPSQRRTTASWKLSTHPQTYGRFSFPQLIPSVCQPAHATAPDPLIMNQQANAANPFQPLQPGPSVFSIPQLPASLQYLRSLGRTDFPHAHAEL